VEKHASEKMIKLKKRKNKKMKSKIIKLLLPILFLFTTQLSAQSDYIIKAGGMSIINVTSVAEAFLGGNSASIGGFSGLNFDLQAEMELWAATIQVRDSLGYDVFTVELPYISSNAEGGLAKNTQLAMESIDSDRYILIGFTISNTDSEEVGRFFTRIVNGASGAKPDDDGLAKTGEEQELTFLEEYVNGIIQEYFNTDGGVKVPRSETEGLLALLTNEILLSSLTFKDSYAITNASEPEWKRTGGSESKKPLSFPVCYKRNDMMKLLPQFTCIGQVPLGNIKIKAKVKNQEYIVDGEIVDSKVIQPLNNEAISVSSTNTVDYWPDFEISWSLSLDGGASWEEKGNTKNTMYFTWGVPIFA
jgi:hypothetical protein